MDRLMETPHSQVLDVQRRDSLDHLYHFPLTGVGQSDSVFQSMPEVTVREGQDAELPCNFSTADPNPYLFWYRQRPHEPPEHRLTLNKYQPKSTETYLQAVDFEKKTVHLRIEGASLSDAAVYHCALSRTVSWKSIALCTKPREDVWTSVRHRPTV